MISKVAGLSFLSGFSHVCYKKAMQKSKNGTKNHIYRTTIKTTQISLKKKLTNIPGLLSDLTL
jgi:hypothetical protein